MSIKNAFGEPVDGGLVTFIPPVSGASAVINSSPAVITGGAASVTASADGIASVYPVTASAAGAASPLIFRLENCAIFEPFPFYLPVILK